MPPPSSNPALYLYVHPKPFFIVQLEKDEGLAPCIMHDLSSGRGGFYSVTRTSEEVSIVGEEYNGIPEKYREQCTWMCIKVKGPMEHSLTGIMADLTKPLKEARVPVFTMSTWNTDYVLVPKEMLADAVAALEQDGWVFVQSRVKSRMARL